MTDAYPRDKGRRRYAGSAHGAAGHARLGAVVLAALLAGAGGLAAPPAAADGPATTLATKYGCSLVKEWALGQPPAVTQRSRSVCYLGRAEDPRSSTRSVLTHAP